MQIFLWRSNGRRRVREAQRGISQWNMEILALHTPP
jgi:hypothetical protein